MNKKHYTIHGEQMDRYFVINTSGNTTFETETKYNRKH